MNMFLYGHNCGVRRPGDVMGPTYVACRRATQRVTVNPLGNALIMVQPYMLTYLNKTGLASPFYYYHEATYVPESNVTVVDDCWLNSTSLMALLSDDLYQTAGRLNHLQLEIVIKGFSTLNRSGLLYVANVTDAMYSYGTTNQNSVAIANTYSLPIIKKTLNHKYVDLSTKSFSKAIINFVPLVGTGSTYDCNKSSNITAVTDYGQLNRPWTKMVIIASGLPPTAVIEVNYFAYIETGIDADQLDTYPARLTTNTGSCTGVHSFLNNNNNYVTQMYQ